MTERPSVLPQLSVRRGRAAVEFYKAAFGAVEVYRVAGTDAHPDVVAQLSVGNASFWVSDESPPHGNFSPESLGGGTVRMLLIVDDPEAVVARAVAAGATRSTRWARSTAGVWGGSRTPSGITGRSESR
jgi:PhnB protein